MAEVVPKIKKLRTFSEDVILARGKSSPTSVPTPSPAPATPPIAAPQIRERKAAVTVLPPKTTAEKISSPPVSRFDDATKKPAPSLLATSVIKESPRAAATPPVTVVPPIIAEEKSVKLNVNVAAISKPAPSILSSSLRDIDVMEDYRNDTTSGSIITDQKRDRFSLIPAAWKAIVDWIASERATWKEAREQERAALPKVQAVEKREEVLKKAAVASALAPKDDHAQVVSRLPMEKPAEAKPTPVIEIKSKEEVPEPSWSHYKGNGTDTPATAASVATEKVISNEAVASTPVTPAVTSSPVPPTTTAKDTERTVGSFLMRHFIANKTPATTTVPPENLSPLKVVAPLEKSAAITAAPTIETKPPIVAPTPTPAEKAGTAPKITAAPAAMTMPESTTVTDVSPITRAEPATNEVKIDVPARVDRTPALDVSKPDEAENPSGNMPKNPNAAPGRRFAPPKPATFPVWRVGLIATSSILLGISAALWFFGGDDNDVPAILADRQPGVELVQADSKAAVSVGNNRDDFLSRIADAKTSSSKSIALIEPTVDLAGEATPINTDSILEILDLRAPANFVRTIEAINFGRYDDNPFLVLKVTSFDISFSGLLQSELSIIADFAPFFGTPVAGTFDPQSRLEGSVDAPFFVDEAVKNHDVRILRDEGRNERLVYGFVNRNTVVIAADSATFAAVADKIK